MTPREQLLKVIETTPEPLLTKALAFLVRLNSQALNPTKLNEGTIPPQDLDFRELSGYFYNPQRKTVTLEEMEQAIEQGALESL